MNPYKKIFHGVIVVCFFISAQVMSDMIDANKALSKKKYALALKELNESAVVGNAEAQYKLGILYFQGKSGKIDKLNALAWMSLAAEKKYPKAIDLAKEIYRSIPENKRAAARQNVKKKMAEFGEFATNQVYYPVIRDEPVSSRRILTPAIFLGRDQIHYNEGGNALFNNSSVIQSLDRNLGTNDGAYSSQNLRKQLINSDSGEVIVQYDIDSRGVVNDVEVVFEYPLGRFTDNVVSNAYTTKYAPALAKNGDKVSSYSIVTRQRFGLYEGGNLNTDYPNIYNRFRKYRTKKETDPVAKYKYAMMLRAYERILSEADRESFVGPLLESAKSGLYLAQLTYAEYEIYEKRNFEAGLPWLFNAASAGLKEAEYRLGDLLMSPIDTYMEKDTEKALFWLNKAAQKSHPIAVEKLASLLLKNSNKAQATKIIKLMQGLPKKEIRANLYYYQAKAFGVLGKTKKAKDSIRKAIALGGKYKQNMSMYERLAKELDA